MNPDTEPHYDPGYEDNPTQGISAATVIILILLGLSALFSCQSASAACDERLAVSLDAWSKHHTGGEYNEHHNAIGFECNNLNVMYFKNSYDRSALGVGGSGNFLEWEHVQIGAYAALWSGYYDQGYTSLGIIPVAAPRITFSLGGAEVSVLPTPYVSVLQVGWRFK